MEVDYFRKLNVGSMAFQKLNPWVKLFVAVAILLPNLPTLMAMSRSKK